jgi:hypothetical protein
MVPDEVVAYGREVAASLQEVLDDDLVGCVLRGVDRARGYVAGGSEAGCRESVIGVVPGVNATTMVAL